MVGRIGAQEALQTFMTVQTKAYQSFHSSGADSQLQYSWLFVWAAPVHKPTKQGGSSSSSRVVVVVVVVVSSNSSSS